MRREFLGIPYRVVRRKVRYPRLEYRTGVLEVILPPGRRAEEVLRRHRTWILRRHEEIEQARVLAARLPVVDQEEAQWRELLMHLVQEAEAVFRIRASRIQVRRMKTKWASCSRRGTLTFNRLTRWLPEGLLRYLAHHEVVHLRYPHHRRPFWETLRRTHPDAEKMERLLLAYWFRLVGTVELPGTH